MLKTKNNEPNRSQRFFYFVGLAQVFCVLLFVLIVLWLELTPDLRIGSAVGMAYLVFVILSILGFTAVINLVSLPVFLLYKKPRGKDFRNLLISLVLSLLILGVFILDRHTAQKNEQRRGSKTYDFLKENNLGEDENNLYAPVKKEITKEEAIQLLKFCRIKQYYSAPISPLINTKEDPEQSSTGIFLLSTEYGRPYRIRVSKNVASDLDKLVQEHQSKCDFITDS